MRRVAGGRQRQRGYVLMMVLAALAVMAYVAQRFAQRNDELRHNALDFSAYAQARASAAGALSAALYWNATRPLTPAGRGAPDNELKHDQRRYVTQDGAFVTVQDHGGLLSINGGDRQLLLSLLVQDGVQVQRAQAMIDVLDDYIDTDSLKRLNGAENAEYQALGLVRPGNDWLVSLRELEGMPLWRDDPERLARLSRSLGTGIGHSSMNPITAPATVLRAMFPTANAAQVELFIRLRNAGQLYDDRVAQSLTGLPFAGGEYLFAAGNASRITVWAPGLPRALEYNAKLLPAGELGPWVITEQHSSKRPTFTDEAPPALPFPLAPGGRQQGASQPSP